jgi:hypothetical protein
MGGDIARHREHTHNVDTPASIAEDNVNAAQRKKEKNPVPQLQAHK